MTFFSGLKEGIKNVTFVITFKHNNTGARSNLTNREKISYSTFNGVCCCVFSEMASEEQVWRNAAQTVLRETQQGALHYLDIKRMILEKGLVGPGLQTTLESVLFKDVRGDLHQTNAKAKFYLIFDAGLYEKCINFFKKFIRKRISFAFGFA